MSRRSLRVVIGVGICICVAILSIALLRTTAKSGCTLYASPSGTDAGAGTATDPFRTAGRLVRALAGGGTGCLAEGVYRETLTIDRGGAEQAPLVLRTIPGRPRATIAGIVTVADGADWVHLDDLRIDGRAPQSQDDVLVKIFGDHVTLSGSDVTSGGTRICVQTGDARGRFGIAWYPVIEGNRIHDCGNRLTGPKTYPSGHAVYLEADRHALVRDNVIYDTNYGGTLGGRGIQLWPDSEDTTIENNVVDNSNAWNIIVSGAPYPTGMTRDVVIRDNILTNPVESSVTSAWWGGAKPQPGVVVEDNCLWGAPGSPLAFEEWRGQKSYSARDNVVEDPGYRDRGAKDFRRRSGGRCEGKGPDDTVAQPW